MDGNTSPNSAASAGVPPRLAGPSGDFAMLLGCQAAALAAVGLMAKAALLPFPVKTLGELLRWGLRLGVVSSADAAFAVSLAGGCLAVGLLLRRWPRVARCWRWLVLAMFQFAGLYSVASVGMLRLAMAPLTLPLLSFAGGPWLMGSSIATMLTPGALTALAASPLLLGLATRLPIRGALGRWAPLCLAGAAGTVLVFCGVCQVYITRQWTDPNRWERRIAVSPQAAFLASCVRGVASGDPLAFSVPLGEVDASDFAPRAARPRSAVVPAGYAARAAAPVVWPEEAAASRRGKNLIVVVLESVGANYLGLYGSPHDTTPHLARLVERGGIVFDNFYSQAPSSPKCLVALTAAVFPRPDWKLITRDSPGFDVPLLPQVLAQRGYRTAYAHSGYWSWKNRDRFLRARGVERLIDADTLVAEKPFSWGVSDQTALEASLAWIDEDPQRPFHLLFWTIETHHPYLVTGPERDFRVADPELNRYLNAVAQADRLIARLVEELERRGLADETLIAVTGDHGEAFGQHGQRAHSFGVYEENVHVPLVLLDRSLGTVRRASQLGQQIDIAPTCVGRMGIEPPHQWQGRDLLAELPLGRAYFFALGNEVLLGLREGNFKYHYHVQAGYEALFDLGSDPGETQNLASAHPQRVGQYRRRVAGLVQFQRRFLAEHGSR